MRPFADDRWWPLGLVVVVTAGLVATAVLLAGRRDVGRGLWPERRGAAHAAAALLSPTGLVWRLQRGALARLGGGPARVRTGLRGAQRPDPGPRGGGDGVVRELRGETGPAGAYWASMMQIAGMAVAVYVVTLLLRLRHAEAEGTLEPLLATGVSRSRWLAAHAVNAAGGAALLLLVFAVSMGLTGGRVLGGTATLLGDLVAAALVQLPAIGVLGAAVLAVVMVVPRWSVGVSWALVVVCVFVGPMFGPSLGLPGWLLDVSPFSHVPNAPAVAITAGPVVGLVATCVLLAVVGVLALRRRDLLLPA